jgi:hypothetical protein
MSTQITDNRQNPAVRCVTSSKLPPCIGEDGVDITELVPTPFAGYSGPTEGAIVPPETPNTVMVIPVGGGQINSWFAISDLNASTVPVGGQDVFQTTAQTLNSTWITGGFPGGGTSLITSLPVGTYDISFSLTVSQSTQSNVNMIVALGTHSLGGTFTVSGTPIIQPQAASTKLYNVAGFVVNDDMSEAPNISARGSLNVTTPLTNVGLIAQINKDGDFGVANINMTISKLA